MLSGSENYYDDIYSSIGKEYAAEADRVHKIVKKFKHSPGTDLLDVACGTGTHAGFLSRHYDVMGIDANAAMLKVARKKHPAIRFQQGDMRDFDLGRTFDIVTCLFSAIGYMRTKSELRKAVMTMSRHLLPGGILLVEPWFAREQWNVGRVSTILVEKPDRKIVRMSHAGIKGRISLLTFDYLIGTAKGVEHLSEHHEFGLFSHDEYMDAFKKAGLDVTHDPEGVDGRGLYIGVKPGVPG